MALTLVPPLRAIDAYKGTHVVKCALMIVPLLMVRRCPRSAGRRWSGVQPNWPR